MTTPPIEPSSYLRYLPGIYTRQSDPFLGNYLRIFEKILTGWPDATLNGRKGIQELLAAEVIGNLFYPRFSFLFPTDGTQFIPPIEGKNETDLLTEFNSYIGAEPPPDPLAEAGAVAASTDPLAAFKVWLNDFLAWVAGWIELVLDSGWGLDQKRMVIAQALALYRLRGTPQGLKFLLDLLFGFPTRINGTILDPATGQTTVSTGSVSLEVVNPTPPGITVTDAVTRGSTFVLRDVAGPGMPVVAGYLPSLFIVRIVLPTQSNPNFYVTDFTWLTALLPKLRTVVEATRPALTRWRLEIVPGVRLMSGPITVQLTLGPSTLLGSQE